METRRRGRWPALQLPPRLAAVRATVSPVAFPAPAPYTDASRPAPEQSLPATEGSLPHPTEPRRPPLRARPVGCSADSAAPDCFRTLDRGGAAVGARRRRVPSRSPAASRRAEGGGSSLVRHDLGLSPPFPFVTGLGSPAAEAVKPRGHAVGTGHGLAPVGAHSITATPASARKSCTGDANAAEGLF